jgi:quercetin dioxygenase-like cupin family protein
MSRHIRLLVALFIAVVALPVGAIGGSAAPPEPQVANLPCATNVSVQVLGSTAPANAEGQSMVLARVIFGVDGSLGAHTHPGTVVASIESGTLGFTLLEDGEMPIMRSGDAGTPAVEEVITTGQEVELKPGDSFVEMGMIHSARAVGDEPAVVVLTGLIETGQALTICVE